MIRALALAAALLALPATAEDRTVSNVGGIKAGKEPAARGGSQAQSRQAKKKIRKTRRPAGK